MHILAVTERQEDLDFCKKLAEKTGFTVEHDPLGEQVIVFIQNHAKTVIFWELDPDKGSKSGAVRVDHLAQRLLRGRFTFDRVFGLSDSHFSELKNLEQVNFLGHHLLRRYSEPLCEIYSFILKNCFDLSPFGLEKYLPKGTTVKHIVLKRSREKAAALNAIENLLQSQKVHPQIANLLVQGTDELIINAIFDAPVDDHSFPYRRALDRAAAFDLTSKEAVTLSLALTKDYLALSIKDHFGSLEKEIVLSFLRKDYSQNKYKIQTNAAGAGLGVYGMLQSGLSLLFTAKPKDLTEVIIFLPLCKNMRSFRTSFQFFSFMMR